MTRRIVVWGTVALLVGSLAVIIAAQKKTDLPAGVLAEMCIPISESAGVALNNSGQGPHESVGAYQVEQSCLSQVAGRSHSGSCSPNQVG